MKIFNPEGYNYVTVVQIPKDKIEKLDMALCKEPSQTLLSYYNSCKEKPDLIMNGGFFNMATGKSCFIFQDEQKIITYDPSYQEGMSITNEKNLSLSTIKVGSRDFISGYPVLMRGGTPAITVVGDEINYKARRSILGYDNNHIYLIAVEKPGLNFYGCQMLLQSLGVENAINLDGGGSTKILKDGKSLTSSFYNRAVDNVFCVYLKENVLYRVQVGAFSNRVNALAYQLQIRLLKDEIGAGYKNAYIRTIDNLYKIQIGAYSKKENAQRVVNDLKSKGYNAFITTK